MFCLVKPRKHYIMLLSYRILIIVPRYGTIFGARNTKKLERVKTGERALIFVYKDKKSTNDRLLNWIGLHSRGTSYPGHVNHNK